MPVKRSFFRGRDVRESSQGSQYHNLNESHQTYTAEDIQSVTEWASPRTSLAILQGILPESGMKKAPEKGIYLFCTSDGWNIQPIKMPYGSDKYYSSVLGIFRLVN